MSNSSLVDYTKLSPNCNKPRNKPITKITIHHMAGNLSVESCGSIFSNPNRGGSSNYGIGSDGRVGLYVEEKNRAWTSSSGANDNQAVTIEVANIKGAPNWEVGATAYAKLIDLCVDICKRNNIPELIWTGDKNGTLTCHYMFAATACPGPYLKSKMVDIAKEVNARLKNASTPIKPIDPQPTPIPTITTGKYIWKGVDYGPVFDAAYYRATSKDVIPVYGKDDKQLFAHFCDWGMKEGRLGNSEFNVKIYKDAPANGDLRNAYGNYLPDYYLHYCLFGKNENRIHK